MADQPVIDRFRAWLREHAVPVTAQRLAIANVILSAKPNRHFSAEEIELELAANGITAGTATIYRTLDLLIAGGFIVARDFAEGFRRFEPVREPTRQEQLLCTSCGRVDELRDDRVDALTSAAAESHGFLRESHRLVIYGVCRDCLTAANATPGNATSANATPATPASSFAHTS